MVKKLILSLIALSTVAGHYVIYSQNQREIHDTVKVITQDQVNAINISLADNTLAREKEFARKSEVEKVVVKIDVLNDQIASMRAQVASLEGFLKGRERKRNNAFWGTDSR